MISSAEDDESNVRPSRKTHPNSLRCQSQSFKWVLSLLVRFIYVCKYFRECHCQQKKSGERHEIAYASAVAGWH